jgi:hypothetical protein
MRDVRSGDGPDLSTAHDRSADDGATNHRSADDCTAPAGTYTSTGGSERELRQLHRGPGRRGDTVVSGRPGVRLSPRSRQRRCRLRVT